jgi:hypothetical protein
LFLKSGLLIFKAGLEVLILLALLSSSWNYRHVTPCLAKHICLKSFETYFLSTYQWHMSIILSPQEAEIRRISVQNQPRQIVGETLSWKKKKKNIVKGNGSGCD